MLIRYDIAEIRNYHVNRDKFEVFWFPNVVFFGCYSGLIDRKDKIHITNNFFKFLK